MDMREETMAEQTIEQAELNAATTLFVKAHGDDDVNMLALKGCGNADVNLPLALQQIAGRQKAKKKLPSWYLIEGLYYPLPLSMEQCSSESSALYKKRVVERWLSEVLDKQSVEAHHVDLTGGLGVDFSFMAKDFGRATYVEHTAALCRLARHNLPLLGLPHADVVCEEAEDYLSAMEPVDVLFVDPARRDSHGGRTFAIEQCTPDVLHLRPLLLAKAKVIVIKLSPMLDWRKAVSDMGRDVVEVHIVAVAGECKELLLVLESKYSKAHRELKLYCVNDDKEEIFRFQWSEDGELREFSDAEGQESSSIEGPLPTLSTPFFLFEPHASLMKSGCFATLARRYGVRQLSANSHLFCATSDVPSFPGRRFAVDAVSSLNKKQLKPLLEGLRQANITVRNFPLTVDELRRRLKIKEGGSTYIFATTLADRTSVLLFCHR